MIQCQGCHQEVAGVVHYHVSGTATAALCPRCYAQAWAQRHHPYARITQQLYALLRLKTRRCR